MNAENENSENEEQIGELIDGIDDILDDTTDTDIPESVNVKEAFTDCIRSLQKIEALQVAVQFAANHDCEFDVSDALAAILTLIEQLLVALDELEVAL